jgi:protein TonB
MLRAAEADRAAIAPSATAVGRRGANLGDAPVPAAANQTYFEFQVEQPVSAVPGNSPPRYPTDLREAGVEGEVLAQFVVDPDGRPELATFKVLKSTHDGFTSAVLRALPNMKFRAAEVGGRAVHQLIQMPFQFSLAKP